MLAFKRELVYKQLIKQNQQLSKDIRGEAMTIAEALRKEGKQEGHSELIFNMLENGITKQQIADSTGLELKYIEELVQAQQNLNTKH